MFTLDKIKNYFNGSSETTDNDNVINIEKPFVPKNGNVYWVVEQNGSVYIKTWRNKTADLNYYLAKNCFKTCAEAQNKAEEVVKRYKDILKTDR